MKHRGHVYMAHLIHEELYRNKGWLEIKTIPDTDGKRKSTKYKVPEVLADAILHHRGCFIAGSIGPDFFPDMITGQMYIHPQNSGKFLEFMYEQLRMLHPNTQEFEKALAFYAGWLMHYCGDMYGHQYVNLYSYGWFPSIADLLYDAVELVGFMPEGEAPGNSDAQKAVSFFADRVEIEEIATWVDDPSAEPFAQLLNDPKNQEEFCQTMDLDQDDPSLWEKITQIIELVVKACGVINGIATIIRHLAIESYMDKTIQERLDAQDVDFMEEGTVAYDIEKWLFGESMAEAVNLDQYRRTVYYHLDLPKEYIRRCFTTAEAFQALRGPKYTQITYEVTEGMTLALDFMGRYMEHYENAYRQLLKEGGSPNVMADMNLRTRYLDKWVELWYKMVQFDLQYDTPIPDGQRENMFYEIKELFEANIFKDKNAILDCEASTEATYESRILGALRGLGSVLEFFGLGFEVMLKGLFHPAIEHFKAIATPYLELVANGLTELDVTFHEGKVEGYDKSLEVIEAAFRNPALLIQCKPLFNEENLARKFDAEWKNLGTGDSYSGQTNCFNLGFDMLENALQMGKLCLIGSTNLNDLLKADGTDVNRFQEHEVRWALGALVLEIAGKENGQRFRMDGFQLVLDVYTKGKPDPTVSWTVADFTVKKGYYDKTDLQIETDLNHCGVIRCTVPFHPEPIHASELDRCVLRVMRPGRSYPQDVMECAVSIYDHDSRTRLFSVDTVLANVNGYYVEVLPLDQQQVEETISEKLRNALICESFDEVNVTVKVADVDGAGTDEAVYFRILDKNGKNIGVREKGHKDFKSEVSMDKGGTTNDFERDSTATYAIELERTADVREVECFSLRRESDGDKNQAKLYIDKFEVWTAANGTPVTLAATNFPMACHIGKTWYNLSLDLEGLRPEEQEILETEIRTLQVDIKTANRMYAGTDDKVCIQVLSGIETVRVADLNSSRNDFEKGHTDAFTVDITKNGKGILSTEITGFAIVKTNNFTAAGDWEIESVTIRDNDSGRMLGCFNAYSGYDHNTVMLTDNTPTLVIN